MFIGKKPKHSTPKGKGKGKRKGKRKRTANHGECVMINYVLCFFAQDIHLSYFYVDLICISLWALPYECR